MYESAPDGFLVAVCAHGYELKVAREAVDLLCTRIESFFWEGHAKSWFRAYRVWVVDIERTDAPQIRASRGASPLVPSAGARTDPLPRLRPCRSLAGPPPRIDASTFDDGRLEPHARLGLGSRASL